MPSTSPWTMGYYGPIPYGHPVYQRPPSHFDYLYGSGMMMGPPGGSYRPVSFMEGNFVFCHSKVTHPIPLLYFVLLHQKRQQQSAESGANRPVTDEGGDMMPNNHDERIGFGITFDKLRKMTEMIQAKIGNITCVMKEMGFVSLFSSSFRCK